ncbi:B12-binding domain-containing radical SAM protein [Candidatus Woesearchaeota archaeon]|nr:B12-binding domain-containing radical SAM protein [Candidatus Woesearchaeota archaeon]
MKISLLSTSTFPADQGLRTLSACLKRAGHEVKMIFLTLPEKDYSLTYKKSVLNQLDKAVEGSGLIGITAMSSTSTRAKQLIEHYQNRKIPVVWGGAAPTFYPEKCFQHCNIVAVGEAEEALIELAEKLEKNHDINSIKNLYIRKNGKEFKNPVRTPIQNLDQLAHPDYDIDQQLILEKGELVQFQPRHLGTIIYFQTERGCPQACAFCTNNILRELYKGKSDILRTHSVDYVIEELKRLHEKFPHVNAFDLRDETFIIRDINWIREFSEKYIASKIGVRLKCLAEPASMSGEHISEEKIKLMVDAGLTDIIIGIQSGSDRLNKEVYNRFITKNQLLKAANTLNKFKDKLTVMYDVISCNPYESSEDILETIRLVLQIPSPFYLSVNNLIFFEGTPLYRRALQDGFIKQEADSAEMLNYWDRWQHIKLKRKNPYLNLLLNLMRGPATKTRFGLMPRSLVAALIKPQRVTYHLKHELPTKTVGSVVSTMDYFRENIAKPMYRSMPVEFKTWYDQVRYKA